MSGSAKSARYYVRSPDGRAIYGFGVAEAAEAIVRISTIVTVRFILLSFFFLSYICNKHFGLVGPGTVIGRNSVFKLLFGLRLKLKGKLYRIHINFLKLVKVAALLEIPF